MYFNEKLRNDKEIGLIAVEFHGGNIKFLSDELKNDKDIAMKAVEK
jgi:hypothetical protein